MPEALVVVWAAPAAVLLVAGLQALRPRAIRAEQDFLRAVGLPSSRSLVLLHAVSEIALGVGLLVARGLALVAISVAVALLMLAYLEPLRRARKVAVGCACLGPEPTPVTWHTLARNVLLAALALLGAVAAGAGGSVGVLLGGDAAWWVPAALVAGLLGWLILAPHREAPTDTGPETGPFTGIDTGTEPLDYLRTPTPAVILTDAHGVSLTLTDLTRYRPMLLILVSPGCGSCEQTMTAYADWRGSLGPVDVRPVVVGEPPHHWGPEVEEALFHDLNAEVSRILQMRRTPSAVLLGADQMLAGGPVEGYDAIAELVGDIRDQLREAEQV